MRVLVTGATGFIGSALLPALARAGHESAALDLRQGRIRLGGARAVVHLAGIAHRRASAEEYERVNVALAREVGLAAAAEGARLVFLSSVKVHGDESALPLAEDAPLAPGDPYAQSKARAEDALRGIAGLELVVLRPALVYGPGVRAKFLRLVQAVASGLPLPLSGIENRRSFLYLGNLVDAVERSLSLKGTYLLSDGEAVSTTRLCERLAHALGRSARLFPVPEVLLPRPLVASMEVDDRAIRTALRWSPRFSLEAGLAATAQWYLSGSRSTS